MSDLMHAPPPKTVDGLFAVPIDITQIDATLTFDGATSTGTGDATMKFVMGPVAGYAIFDLRQTITAAWLNDAPLAVAKVAAHDFGGGPDSALRIVDSLIAAGSVHTLRVTYSLGTPQASTAGSYQPAIVWTPGPRLRFNFGFTDLGAGRYLEAWVPSNLIYDQFTLNLNLRINGTTVAHSVISNGAVTTIALNQWSVAFPSRFTALSPLLEVRATDTLSTVSDTVALPVSGSTVTIELWKLTASTSDLTVQMANLKSWLADNDSTIGRYLHGSRFVAFLNVGGMEYDGGTTTSASALRHETHHSWWGRGVKPASQPDGWFDEAWTVYHDNGATGSLPFDFTASPVELCPQNPWMRITAGGSYSDGERFFRGAAALVGVASLKALMAEFYVTRRGQTVTTAELEAFLVARSGKQDLVDAFHRFVYGFVDPAATPDLWIKDNPAHTGADLWTEKFWDSPDLWIRNIDDDGLTHQPPEFGQDNWFHARLRNRGSATVKHFVVTFNVKPYVGVEFSYPADFLPAVAAVAGFDLAPGATQIVKARWPRALVPAAGTHACWLAAVLTRVDQPLANRHVWEHNNLAQKNLCVVDLQPNQLFMLPFVLHRRIVRIPGSIVLELVRPKGLENIECKLVHRSKAVFGDATVHPIGPDAANGRRISTLDCAGAVQDVASSSAGTTRDDVDNIVAAEREAFATGSAAAFPAGAVSRLPLRLPSQNQLLMGLSIRVPADARPGDILRMDLVQRIKETIVGGIAFEIRVRKPVAVRRPVAETDAPSRSVERV